MNDNVATRNWVRASRSDRCIAYMIDVALIIAISVSYFLYWPGNSRDEASRFYNTVILQPILYLCKDIFGRSPGKALWGLRIVQETDHSKRASPFSTIVRNFFLLGGMVEPLVIVFNKDDKRLGDILTKTVVVGKPARVKKLSVKDLVGDVKDDTSSVSKCIQCGAEIPVGKSRCPNCGWSYAD